MIWSAAMLKSVLEVPMVNHEVIEQKKRRERREAWKPKEIHVDQQVSADRQDNDRQPTQQDQGHVVIIDYGKEKSWTVEGATRAVSWITTSNFE